MFQTYEPAADRSFGQKHLPALRARMSDMGLDGFLVPHDDAYLNEYLPPYAERLMWLSGFSGSAGSAIVLADRAAVFSDGRYRIQLREQVDDALFALLDSGETSPADWLAEQASSGMRIGYDPYLHADRGLAPFRRAAEGTGFELVAVDRNPIDAAWGHDQPAPPRAPIKPHDIAFAGEDAAAKRVRIGERIASLGADMALLTAPHSVAWLLNVRGGDVHASPLPLSRVVLRTSGRAILYAYPEKVTDELRAHLGPEIEIRNEDDLPADLEALPAGTKVLFDPGLTLVAFTDRIAAGGASGVAGQDPCALPRAVKNEIELDGSRAAHLRDGAAVTKFLHWLSVSTARGEVTEIGAARQLETFRREGGQLRDVSFDTISGAGPHGAVVHYRVTTPTDRTLDRNSLFLVDSGGQYDDGTTDITRTVAIGEPDAEMRRAYTIVLKGHIALATARFPKKTTGHQLDALARAPLWAAGLDYDHGTGHGVGSYLGVHEGPQNISKRAVDQALEPGMICSNEPGFYREGEWGIRIENLVIVTPPAPIEGGEREMLGFETVTLAPLDRQLIDASRLSNQERDWVDAYHARVREALTPSLPADVAHWLEGATAPLT